MASDDPGEVEKAKTAFRSAGYGYAPAAANPTAQPTGDTSSDSGGGISGWIADSIVGAINSFFKGVVGAALTPPAHHPHPGPAAADRPAVEHLLGHRAGLLRLARQHRRRHCHGARDGTDPVLHTRQLTTRIPLGFIAAAMSLFVCGQAVVVANALSRAVTGPGVDENSASQTLRDLILSPINFQSGGLYLVLLGGVLAGLLVALLVVYAVRVALTVILIAGAPVALMCHALPQTEGVARWWWTAFGGLLAIQVVQSLTLITAMRVFLGPGGFTMFGTTQTGLVNLVVSLGLVYILFKTPFWILGSIGLSNRGNFVSSLARDYVVAKSMGMLKSPTPKDRSQKATRSAAANPATARRRGRPASSSTLGSVPAAGRPRRPLPPPGQPLFLSPAPTPDSASRPAERPTGPPPDAAQVAEASSEVCKGGPPMLAPREPACGGPGKAGPGVQDARRRRYRRGGRTAAPVSAVAVAPFPTGVPSYLDASAYNPQHSGSAGSHANRQGSVDSRSRSGVGRPPPAPLGALPRCGPAGCGDRRCRT